MNTLTLFSPLWGSAEMFINLHRKLGEELRLMFLQVQASMLEPQNKMQSPTCMYNLNSFLMIKK